MSLKTSHSYKKVWELLPSTWWWTQLWRCEKIHSFTHTEIICSSNKYLLSTCLKTKKYHPNLLHRSSYFWLCVHLYCFLFLLLLLLYLWLTKIKLFCKTHFPFWLISFPVLQNWLFSHPWNDPFSWSSSSPFLFLVWRQHLQITYCHIHFSTSNGCHFFQASMKVVFYETANDFLNLIRWYFLCLNKHLLCIYLDI